MAARGIEAAIGAFIAEDALHRIQIGICGGEVRHRGQLKQRGIEGLLVLAPADIADEAGIVEDDALAATNELEAVNAGIGDLGAVELRIVRVRDNGVAGAAIGGGVVAVVEPVHDFRFQQNGETLVGPRLEAGAHTRGDCVGILRHAVLRYMLVAQPRIEDGRDDGFGPLAFGGLRACDKSPAGCGQKACRHQRSGFGSQSFHVHCPTPITRPPCPDLTA